MKVETLIYAYLAICVSMIIFNIVCIYVFSGREKKAEKVSRKFLMHVESEIERVSEGFRPDKKHLKYLKKKLRRTGNLLAFDAALDELYQNDTHRVMEYLSGVYPVFVYLADKYSRQDEIRVTFFLHILRKYRVLNHKPNKQIDRMVLELLKSKSIYLRQNAFETVLTTGNTQYVLHAIRTIDELKVYHNAKLITDGLLKFTGSFSGLSGALWENLGSYSIGMQVALVNFFRLHSGRYHSEMLALLMDETVNDEVRFACMRYFGKYRYEPAHPVLLSLADEKAVTRWEYAAIASSALAVYPMEATVRRLKQNLSSHEWYIRFNAARSLNELGVSGADVADIFAGRDRYAQDMLRYRMEKRSARREEAV